MKIETQISFEEYFKLMLSLAYKKAVVIYISLIATIGIIVDLSITNESNSENRFSPVTLITIIVMIPLLIYFNSRRNYNSNKRIQEKITYEFLDDKMIITGESFKSEMGLKEAYKIQELKNWFLIYQSKQVANLIPKKALRDSEISELRNDFRKLPIKLTLKKS